MGIAAILTTALGWVKRLWPKKPQEGSALESVGPVTQWPMKLIAISVTGIWITIIIATLQIKLPKPSQIYVVDTTCQNKYSALFQNYLFLQQKCEKTQDSLNYLRNLRLTPSEAASAIERRYRK